MFWLILAGIIIVIGIIKNNFELFPIYIGGALIVLFIGLAVTYNFAPSTKTVLLEYKTPIGENNTGFISNTPSIFYLNEEGNFVVQNTYDVRILNTEGKLYISYSKIKENYTGFFVYNVSSEQETVIFTLE